MRERTGARRAVACTCEQLTPVLLPICRTVCSRSDAFRKQPRQSCWEKDLPSFATTWVKTFPFPSKASVGSDPVCQHSGCENSLMGGVH